MFTKHLQHLICISCGTPLSFKNPDDGTQERIETGTLFCSSCKAEYPIIKGVPRFVPSDHYTQAFGFQWLKHARTQFDSYTGMPVSEKRIRIETKWPETLTGEKILEAGCGSGRFTEQLLKKGAFIAAFDASVAVEANYEFHGNNPSVLIVQADIYKQPFKDGYFDKGLCIGVLQHTPDPKKSIASVVSKVRSGGLCAMDIYRKNPWYRQMWNTKYWARPFFKHMKPERLYKLCTAYITLMWPLANIITRLPFGRSINQKILIPELLSSSKYKKFSNELHKEWTILHLFDWLNPTYDQPQNEKTFRSWLQEAGLTNIETGYDYGGVDARGMKD
jgi:SAM-dependent methyltransferase